MRRHPLLAFSFAALAAVACDSAPASSADASPPNADAAVRDASAPEVDTDATPSADVPVADAQPVDGSVAGRACEAENGMPDIACGDADLACFTIRTRRICTQRCTNSATQTSEQTQCGDALSTCLTAGEGAAAVSYCLAACRPRRTASTFGACSAGFVCTGWWYTHVASRPDTPGCYPFCSDDAHCPTGMHCNPRTGACSDVGVVMTRRPDGFPCDPTQTVTDPGNNETRSAECRGLCLVTTGDPARGMCGSQVNLRVITSCPDSPDRIVPSAPSGADDLGMCVLRRCTANADCMAPLVCRYPENMGVIITTIAPTCGYPSTLQPTGIADDGGTPRDAVAD